MINKRIKDKKLSKLASLCDMFDKLKNKIR